MQDIIFADALVGRRGDKEQNAQERVLSTLLTEMDGVGIHLDAHTRPNEVCVKHAQLICNVFSHLTVRI